MKQGTIKKLFTDRKFGFINETENNKDLFFDDKDLNDCGFEDLKEGIAVKFEIIENEKGLCATNIVVTIESDS